MSDDDCHEAAAAIGYDIWTERTPDGYVPKLSSAGAPMQAGEPWTGRLDAIRNAVALAAEAAERLRKSPEGGCCVCLGPA
jgi:hypothetical protein